MSDLREASDGPNTHKMDAPSDVTSWTVVHTVRNVIQDDGRGMTPRDEWWHIPTFVADALIPEGAVLVTEETLAAALHVLDFPEGNHERHWSPEAHQRAAAILRHLREGT